MSDYEDRFAGFFLLHLRPQGVQGHGGGGRGGQHQECLVYRGLSGSDCFHLMKYNNIHSITPAYSYNGVASMSY